MYVDGDRLIVSIDSDLAEVREIAEFVKTRLDFIEGVSFEEDKPASFGSSALFGLLAAMKNSKPKLDIALFNPLGFSLGAMGTLYWEGVEWIKNA
jgi:hypothetical protein